MYRYIEIADQLEEKFNSDKFKKGEKVDSVRLICKSFKCHVSTAMKALHYLRDKEVIYAIPQSGFYYMGKVKESKVSDTIIDFKSSSPDPNLFPYKDYQTCVNLAIEKNRSALFEYGSMDGYQALKDSIRKLVTHDYIFTESNQVVITSGIQQGLTILTDKMILNGKKKILIEQPSYPRYLEYLKLGNYEVETINRNFSGLDLEALEILFKRGDIKFFYLMPRVHNPLGTSLTKEQKKRLVELAYQYHVYLVEDDYMADYVMDKSNDPLFTYDVKRSHVIYLRSFSKIIFPGLRVGFAILPKDLIEDFSYAKYYNDMGTSLLSQASLNIFLANKMYERQVKKMKKIYEDRARQMHKCIHEVYCMNSLDDNGIIHTCIELKKPYSVKSMDKLGVYLADINDYYFDTSKIDLHYMPINVSNVDKKSIQRGLTFLQTYI